ncbi:MAG: NCS2 family permease [Tissierellia bacterium]|nr:NCS2 family permease [Tissierellia bacterium]
MAGITTFMTMAYILAVNPLILSDSGMDAGGVFTATALSAAIATLMMALYAKYPFGLAPGMGLNAFFAYTVVLEMGRSWEFALTAVLLEGIIFILLSAVNIREKIFESIPVNLKNAVSVGIGLFIAFIGLSSANIVTAGDGTLIGLGDLTAPSAVVTVLGILITGFLFAKNVKGALLYGIIISTLIGIPLGVTQLPKGFTIMSLPPSIKDVAFKFVSFEEILSFDMLVVLFTFLFVDIFDTVGTLAGVASKANMLDEKGRLPRVGKALMADAVGTVAGACLGTSTVTTFVESASGVAAGGRTGLTALTTAAMFLLALFFAPIFTIIPAEATAPALIIVGLFMMGSVKNIDFDDFTEAIPAFLTIVMMPFAYSIAEGIVAGMITYTILKTVTGKTKEVSATMWILTILFIARIIFM